MGNRFYRRSAVLAVGGFNRELQVMEDTELRWRLEKAGYKEKFAKDVTVFHIKSGKAFTLHTILDYAFTYGYCWHKLYYMHPDKTRLSAMPVKFIAFVIIVLLSCCYPSTLWAIPASLLFWFVFKLYRLRRNVRNCIYYMKGITAKIGALMVIIPVVVLSDITKELGKIYAIFISFIRVLRERNVQIH